MTLTNDVAAHDDQTAAAKDGPPVGLGDLEAPPGQTTDASTTFRSAHLTGAEIEIRWLGRVGYDAAHELQLALRDARIADPSLDPVLLLSEHEPVITFGRRGESGDLRVTEGELTARGIALRHAERGGRATYHGPGQLVGYLIGHARALAPDLPTLVWRLEETMIHTLAEYDLAAARCYEGRGVWVGDAKLGAVGVAVTRGVCWHGFALNVAPDLSTFELIRPCGLDVPVTSIADLTGAAPPIHDVAHVLAAELGGVFQIVTPGTP
ncbi:MAG: lipoyl(octanoyl) transferase [Chloroflexota bacterium]|nr:lipoyl(octanoyl) transferase [Chloroflexota bacterium]